MSWTRPEVDYNVTLYCEECEWYWHPAIYYEYRGLPPHGGNVAEYTIDAFDCPICSKPAEEV